MPQMRPPPAKDVESYLRAIPKDKREALLRLRKIIKEEAPDATESIKWGMPMFTYKGLLVAYASFKEHVSFFIMSTRVADAHKKDLSKYDSSKGTVRFTPDKPLPKALVKKLVKARIRENEEILAERKAKSRTK